MDYSPRTWIRIALFNLMLLALIGVVLRYKIAFYLPFIHQKHLLHGHSHFAFNGWVGLALMAGMVNFLLRAGGQQIAQKYNWFLLAHILLSYGMLIAFPIQGYGPVSITLSTLSLFVYFAFAFYFWKDLDQLPERTAAHAWFKAGLFFASLSSLGAFGLAYLMVNRIANQTAYLASEYFFLHFQYNGWFFFACMGFLADHLQKLGAPAKSLSRFFNFFFLAAIPAYLLSTLWMKLPVWLYALAVLAVVFQLLGAGQLWTLIRTHAWTNNPDLPRSARFAFVLSFTALCIKLLLQTGSVIPAMSTLAFGYRPIVIGYLHLVLLGFTSLFIIAHFIYTAQISQNIRMLYGLRIFAGGIILNEVLLMLQGVAGIVYIPLPMINEALFTAACIMFLGLAWMNAVNQRKNG